MLTQSNEPCAIILSMLKTIIASNAVISAVSAVSAISAVSPCPVISQGGGFYVIYTTGLR